MLFVDSDPLAGFPGLDSLAQPEDMSLNDIRDIVKHNMGLLTDDLSDSPRKM